MAGIRAMPILFPPKDDVTLEAPPLAEVICQVRFAPILRIVEGLPSAYQELLRARFPKFARRDPLRIEIKGIVSLPAAPLPNEFVCETADGQSNAALGVDFVALSTQKYSHWESFAADLGIILRAFEQVYGPTLATRIGLRYINGLRLANTGTDSLDSLVDFLNPELTHFYRNPAWSPPEKVASLVLLREDNESLALRIGVESTPEARVVLDYDYYTELSNPTEMKADLILETVSHYHQMIYNAFRWSIREEKIDIFRPVK
jgi:uncharacterized protein (TIGR04255 family)